MKVAFVTTDGKRIQGELRRATIIVVFDVGPGGWNFERASAFRDAVQRSEHRLQALHGVTLLYVAAIGPSTAARVAARGIRPATAPEGTAIDDVLGALSQELRLRQAQREGHAS